MKKNLSLILTVIVSLGIFCLTACTQNEPLATLSEPLQQIVSGEQTVTVEIDYGTQKAGAAYPADYLDGLTAWDALTEVAEESGWTVAADDSAYGKYIKAINDVTEDGTNFWLFSVNGEMAQQSADSTILKAGDTVNFSFSAM